MKENYSLPVLTAVFIILILLPVQIITDPPLLLLERLFAGGGFLQIGLVAAFGFILEYNMLIPGRSAWWRRFSWSMYSAIFFLQLILGIAVDRVFLMSGNLHLPVPAMIISGPIYRGSFSVMTLIFLGAILLSGPAWCSQFCYFGAIDSAVTGGKPATAAPVRNRMALKNTFLLLAIAVALALRVSGAGADVALAAGIITGIAGLLIIIFLSRTRKKMIHCTLWCPVGTLTNYLKFLNPFRLRIRDDCTQCMHCSSVCRYDALGRSDIQRLKPGITCTLCGDCLTSCRSESIYYHFPGLKPSSARKMYITVTVILFSMVLALGRI